eukprot:5226730-Lingulodinium_polyedra.AAC.1
MNTPGNWPRVKTRTCNFASRCNGGWSIQPHRCGKICKHRATMRSNRRSVAAMALKSHARARSTRALENGRARGTICKRCTTMRSNPLPVAATAR